MGPVNDTLHVLLTHWGGLDSKHNRWALLTFKPGGTRYKSVFSILTQDLHSQEELSSLQNPQELVFNKPIMNEIKQLKIPKILQRIIWMSG